MVAVALIIIPCSYLIFFTNIQLFGLVGGIIVDIFYIASIVNLMRLIYRIAHTDPGVVPAIPLKRTDVLQKLGDNQKGIYV